MSLFPEFYKEIILPFTKVLSFYKVKPKTSQFNYGLVSGTKIKLVESYNHIPAKNIIMTVNEQIRIRKSDTSPPFYFIKHSALGGATTFRGVYSISDHLRHPQYSNVKRTIKSFMEFGLKTYKRVHSSFVLPEQLLSPYNINTFVQIKNEYGLNSLEYRRLTLSEISYIYGIPRQFHDLLNHTLFQHLVPVHILDGLLLANLCQSHRKRSHTMISLPSYHYNKEGTWIPSLKRWLPHQWHSSVTDTKGVAKNDDASIPIEFWNGRIKSIFPQVSDEDCDKFRMIVHKQFCKNLVKDFSHYLGSNNALTTAKGLIKLRGVGVISQHQRTTLRLLSTMKLITYKKKD